jgi:epoxyqueuosine reductase
MSMEQTIKQLAHDLGADLCGIAPVERFDEAPAGFRPRDIFPQAKSVVAVAKCMPEGPYHSKSAIPYTVASNVTLLQITRIVIELCSAIERQTGTRAMPVPSEPYEYWDEEKREGRGLLSLKHAGWLAGLGVITANSLLTNNHFGNRISLGAALLDIELNGDKIADYNFGCEKCHRCIDACEVHAISGGIVNQKVCRTHYESKTARGAPLYVCNACRKLCPNGRARPAVAPASKERNRGAVSSGFRVDAVAAADRRGTIQGI